MHATLMAVALTADLIVGGWQYARADAEPTGKLLIHEGGVEAIAIQPNGRWLATGGGDGMTRLWDLKAVDPSARDRFVLRGHSKPVSRVTISPNGRWLATGSIDGTVRVWDLEAPNPAGTNLVLRGFRPALWPAGPTAGAIAFSANSRRVLTAFNEIRTEQVNNLGWRARVWDLQAADPTATGVLLEGAVHVAVGSGRLEGVGLNPRWVVSGMATPNGPDMRVWDLNAAGLQASVVAATARVGLRRGGTIVPELSPDGRWLFARTGAGTVDEYRLWDVRAVSREGTVLLTNKFPAPARASGFSPDSRWLAAAIDAKPYDVRLWDLRAKEPEMHGLTLRGHSDTVRELGFSLDGHWMVSAGDDATVRIWDLRSKDPAASGVVLPASADLLLFTRDSRWMVTGEREKGRLRVWDLEAARTRGSVELPVSEKAIAEVVISSDGRWLVTRDADKAARVWDLGPIRSGK